VPLAPVDRARRVWLTDDVDFGPSTFTDLLPSAALVERI
jgi:hypothetical protein